MLGDINNYEDFMDIIILILLWTIPGAISTAVAIYFIDKVDITLGHVLIGCILGWIALVSAIVYFISSYVLLHCGNPLKIVIFKRKDKNEYNSSK